MSTAVSTPVVPAPSIPSEIDEGLTKEVRSEELAAELNRLETSERLERDRRAQEELARLRELARYD